MLLNLSPGPYLRSMYPKWMNRTSTGSCGNNSSQHPRAARRGPHEALHRGYCPLQDEAGLDHLSLLNRIAVILPALPRVPQLVRPRLSASASLATVLPTVNPLELARVLANKLRRTCETTTLRLYEPLFCDR